MVEGHGDSKGETSDYIMNGKASHKGGQGVPDSLMSSGMG